MLELPGYDVQELLGAGAAAEVWRAVELATGEPVALKRLREDRRSDEDVQQLVREAMVLRSLETPYVVRLRTVVGSGTSTVLVLDLAEGGSLAALLARRGVLTAGEVVTVATPLALALATAHARGVVHGDVAPGNVLLTGDGMPLLADLGAARSTGAGGPVDATPGYVDPAVLAGAVPSPASDVWSLGVLCLQLLTGSPQPARSWTRVGAGADALLDVVRTATDADPAARPDAAVLAVALRRACQATPLDLRAGQAVVSDPLPVTDRVRPRPAVTLTDPARTGGPARRPRPSRRALAVTVSVAAVLAAAGAGWASGQSSAPPGLAALPPVTSTPATRATPAAVVEPDWEQLLTTLDTARAAAFEVADPAALHRVWAPGSKGLMADTAAVTALARAGRFATGVRHRLVSVKVLSGSGTTARLRVVDVLERHSVVDADGRVLHVVGARAKAAYDVRLVTVGGEWRLAAVAQAV